MLFTATDWDEIVWTGTTQAEIILSSAGDSGFAPKRWTRPCARAIVSVDGKAIQEYFSSFCHPDSNCQVDLARCSALAANGRKACCSRSILKDR
ncbi:hypothetical protein SAMN04488030_0088 [Aliiroseovarius halocynthiae]|nr:hypothetical protein SAMN04488030_0088 [Aliiroseovarius halocynthiae]